MFTALSRFTSLLSAHPARRALGAATSRIAAVALLAAAAPLGCTSDSVCGDGACDPAEDEMVTDIDAATTSPSTTPSSEPDPVPSSTTPMGAGGNNGAGGAGPMPSTTAPINDSGMPVDAGDASLWDAGDDAGMSDGGDAASTEPPEMCTENCGCIDNFDCSGSWPVCDRVMRSCVRCLDPSDEGCLNDTPRCKAGVTVPENYCVQCLENNDCASRTGTTACQGNVCVPCSSATHAGCEGDTAWCLQGAASNAENGCVQCLQDAHCGEDAPVCEGNACIACSVSDDEGCAGTALPRCLAAEAPADNQCVQCLENGDCSGIIGSPACDTYQCSTCSPGDDLGCTGPTPKCLAGATPLANSCVQCLENADCGGATPVCEDNVCIPCSTDDDAGCADDAEPRCLEGASAAQNQCVECLDAEDCGDEVPFCIGNVCKECEYAANGDGNADCGPDTPVCSAQGECTTCDGNEDCTRFNASGRGTCNINSGDPTFGQCRECASNAHCTDPSESVCTNGSCGDCTGDAQCAHIAGKNSCLSGNCVECDANADCTTVNESKCNTTTNECGSCTVDADCAHLTNTPACDASSGQCVECTASNSTKCTASEVCALRASVAEFDTGTFNKFTCYGAAPGTGVSCATCVSDTQCFSGRKCVQMPLGGATAGYFCLPKESGGDASFANCANSTAWPFSHDYNATSLGGDSGVYCGFEWTSCLGFRDYNASKSCTLDSDCGAAGLDDGLCRDNGGSSFCALPCENANDCSSTKSCLALNPNYCQF